VSTVLGKNKDMASEQDVIGKWLVFVRDASGSAPLESHYACETRDEALSHAFSYALDVTVQRIEGPNGETIARADITQVYLDWFLRP